MDGLPPTSYMTLFKAFDLHILNLILIYNLHLSGFPFRIIPESKSSNSQTLIMDSSSNTVSIHDPLFVFTPLGAIFITLSNVTQTHLCKYVTHTSESDIHALYVMLRNTCMLEVFLAQYLSLTSYEPPLTCIAL